MPGWCAAPERVFVERFVTTDDLIERKALAGVGRGERACRVPARVVAEEGDRRTRHPFDVPDRAERTRLAITHDFRQPAGARSDHGHPGRERLERTQAE